MKIQALGLYIPLAENGVYPGILRPPIRPPRYYGSCISAMSIPLTLTVLERTLGAAMMFAGWLEQMLWNLPCPIQPTLKTSASTSRFSELTLLGDRRCSQEMRASSAPCRHGSCPVAPCGASRHRRSSCLDPFVESLVESPFMELSLDSNFPTLLSISIPRDQGK